MHEDHVAGLPPAGAGGEFVDRLAGYVDTFWPGWRQRVRGASDAEIADLERLAGLTARGWRFPDTYRRYLEFCGHDDGGLLDSMEGRLGKLRTVDDLRRLYQGIAEDPDERDHPRYPVVLGSEIGVFLALDLRPPRRAEPAVISEGTKELFAESWEMAVFQHATLVRARQVLPVCLWTSASPEALAEALARRGASSAIEVLTAFAREHGFTPAWFNDAKHVCLARPDVLVWTGLSHAVFLVVAGTVESTVYQIGDELASAFAASSLIRLSAP
jgi:hypothetical protein